MLRAGKTQWSPGDELPLKLAWRLADGESVTTTEVTAVPPGDLAESPAPATDPESNVTTFWKQGGASSDSTDFQVVITTSLGRVLHRKVTVSNTWNEAGVVALSADDETPIEVDWSNVLQAGEGVDTTEVTAVSNGVVKDPPVPATASGITTFWVENGTAGTVGVFLVTLETDMSRTLHQLVRVPYY